MPAFAPDLGQLDDYDRRLLARFLDEITGRAADGQEPASAALAFLGDLAAAARADGPLSVSADLDAAGRAAAGDLLAAAYEHARSQDRAAAPVVLRVLCEWERFARHGCASS